MGSCGSYRKDDTEEIQVGRGKHAQFIFDNVGTVSQSYDMAEKLGQGSHGSVCKGTSKTTGAIRAIKTVSKSSMKNIDRFRREIDIMKMMDHPNVLKLYEVFEDNQNIYMVMELCAGGELFDQLVEKGHYKEAQAAVLMQQIIKVVFYMHGKRVCHRDVKPENLLFKTQEAVEKNLLKIIDFGLSCPFTAKQELTTRVGSLYYVAPQVLQGKYDHLSDLWSCGVIMYILLCGVPPFSGSTDLEILTKARRGQFSFDGKVWGHVSADAKDLICMLLKTDPHERFTAEQALNHTWIKNKAPKAKKVSLQSHVVGNLRSFQAHNKLKKAALHVIASTLSDAQIKALRKTFQALDSNGDGQLNVMEMKSGILNAGLKEIPPDLEQIMEAIDADGTGVIDYTEFIAAALDKKDYLHKKVCRYAFHVFDRNGDGKISRDELKQVLINDQVGDEVGLQTIADIMAEVDSNGDDHISWDEFQRMMKR